VFIDRIYYYIIAKHNEMVSINETNLKHSTKCQSVLSNLAIEQNPESLAFKSNPRNLPNVSHNDCILNQQMHTTALDWK